LEWADYLNSGVVEEESSMIMLDAHIIASSPTCPEQLFSESILPALSLSGCALPDEPADQEAAVY
jgi:hypothetical protein